MVRLPINQKFKLKVVFSSPKNSAPNLQELKKSVEPDSKKYHKAIIEFDYDALFKVKQGHLLRNENKKNRKNIIIRPNLEYSQVELFSGFYYFYYYFNYYYYLTGISNAAFDNVLRTMFPWKI